MGRWGGVGEVVSAQYSGISCAITLRYYTFTAGGRERLQGKHWNTDVCTMHHEPFQDGGLKRGIIDATFYFFLSSNIFRYSQINLTQP